MVRMQKCTDISAFPYLHLGGRGEGGYNFLKFEKLRRGLLGNDLNKFVQNERITSIFFCVRFFIPKSYFAVDQWWKVVESPQIMSKSELKDSF